MTEPTISDEADPLYQPLGGIEPWSSAAVDEVAWDEAVDRLGSLRAEVPDREGVGGQGAMLAAAHQSGALDGLHDGSRTVAVALLRGGASLASLGEVERPHVRANYEALRLARDTVVSEASVRRIHEVACRPQLTHRVRVGESVQDHVLGAGDYKHHPNHVPTGSGGWRPTVPVALVRPEMARLVEIVSGDEFASLHPLAQAAFLHHAVMHVQPFADGNGRVARALAGGCLLRAASVPFLVFADDAAEYERARDPAETVAFVQRTTCALVELLATTEPSAAALAHWRAQAQAAASLRATLAPALLEALHRHHVRPEPTRRADLSGTVATWSDVALVVRTPLADRPAVEEVVALDTHPVDRPGAVVLNAAEAGLRLEVDPLTGAPAGTPLDAWLDRVVSCLALRVAAELEEAAEPPT